LNVSPTAVRKSFENWLQAGDADHVHLSLDQIQYLRMFSAELDDIRTLATQRAQSCPICWARFGTYFSIASLPSQPLPS
jgi:hypothetical protein